MNRPCIVIGHGGGLVVLYQPNSELRQTLSLTLMRWRRTWAMASSFTRFRWLIVGMVQIRIRAGWCARFMAFSSSMTAAEQTFVSQTSCAHTFDDHRSLWWVVIVIDHSPI